MRARAAGRADDLIGVYPKPFLERMEVTVVELLQDDQRRLVNLPPLGELIGAIARRAL